MLNLLRKLWVPLSRRWANWSEALIIVKPATVIRWHRAIQKPKNPIAPSPIPALATDDIVTKSSLEDVLLSLYLDHAASELDAASTISRACSFVG